MNLSKKAQDIHLKVSAKDIKLGDLRKIAKTIKKDHDLAMELWKAGGFMSRQLAILIMDKKHLNQEMVDKLVKDMDEHPHKERNHLADWLMANQLAKDKMTIALMLSWQNSHSEIQRRLFWYYQARLRWMGNTDHDNTEFLLSSLEKEISEEAPTVQWAMNFIAGQIGVFDKKYRNRCITLGENLGLYKDEVAPKNCTPNYLPEFIRIQVNKLKK